MTKKQIFLSIKWKAFALTSAFLALLFTVLALGITYTLKKDFDVRRLQTYQRNQSELLAITNSTINRIQQISSIIAVSNQTVDLKEAFRTPEIAAQAFSDLWFQLDLIVGISSAAIFTHQNKQLAFWGEENDLPLELVKKTNETETPHSNISCPTTCKIYIATPYLRYGVHGGTSIYSTPMTNVILDFEAMTNTDIGIINTHTTKTTRNKNYLPNWQANLIAVTSPDTSRAIIEKASASYQFEQLTRTPIHIIGKNKVIELFAFPLPGQKEENPEKIILLTDVTESLNSLNTNLTYVIMVALIGLLLSELLLLLILYRPVKKLQHIASYLPLLAKNDFDSAAKAFAGLKNQSSAFIDESDVINETAIELSSQLKELHREVQNRTLEIETERDFITRLLNTAHALMITQNKLGQIALVNHHTLKITGYQQDQLLNQNFSKLLHYDNRLPDTRLQIQELIHGERSEYNHESDLQCKDKEVIHMAWFHTRLAGRENDQHLILSIAIDISERKKAEEHLGWLASHDPLTGLFNRRRFSEELDRAFSSSIRYNHIGAVLFFDLDEFKDTNDTSGHHVGDMLLRRVAETLKSCIRETDVIARLGGDEFALLILESSEQDATKTAERVRESLSQISITGKNRIHRVSTSIGVVLFPEHGESIEELLTNADIAMYQAKEAGKNGWRLYNAEEYGREYINQRVFWRDKVKQVLAENLITMYYQPIVNLSNNVISHYEALLRVPDEKGNPLPPTELILSAEKSGLIPELDQKIVTEVLHDQARLCRANIEPTVAINLSGISFHNPDIVVKIQREIEKNHIDPRRIIFEITETAAVSDIGITIKIMDELKKIGCLFALDDFGVGFSSLYYLKQFPVDFVKIDGSFIRELHCQPDDQVLVKALVDVSRAFRKKTVAEFVENDKTLELLKDLGVHYAQGYHVGKPLPFNEIWPNVS